jgi:folate-binding protein YgfZ
MFVLGHDAVAHAAADAVLGGALVAVPDVAVLEVTGPGAVACIQGLLTNDIKAPGAGAFLYGAVLTPKGMIVCDLWVERDRSSVRLTVPRQGVGPLLEIFRRSLPPRLARLAESPEQTVLHLAGPRAVEVATRAGLALPAEGRWGSAILTEVTASLARPAAGAPFAVQVVVARAQAPALASRLGVAGAVQGGGQDLELARVLAGWPRLGAEIDDKTLPQEVRYDEIGGVSYTKGCYTGQETVARIHFRGHPNRGLRGLIWDDDPDVARPDVEEDGRPRGRVTSVAWLPDGPVVGLALLRREVEADRRVMAAGAEARVVPLPFQLGGQAVRRSGG